VYVRGPSPRAGLELMRHRPGRHGLLPHRERELAEAERAGGDEALEEAARLAASLAKEPKTLQLSGEPGRAVCEAATRERADLVVVRAAGRDVPPVGPRSLGPVARFITDHCPCPVLLLRSAS
jgi:nucleotide-binding universal stress UspA family protein